MGEAVRRAGGAVLAAALALTAGAAAAQTRANHPSCPPHPLFSPYPGAVTDSDCRRAEFGEIQIDLGGGARQTKSGEFVSVTYDLAPDAAGRWPTPVAVLRNHMNAVTSRGGRIVSDPAAGGAMSATLRDGRGTWWINVRRASGMGSTELYKYTVETVLEAPLAQVVTITADEIRRGLAADGKVELAGVFFDTGSAVLKPESQPALAQMAAYLRSAPAVRVAIVGHTDSTGDYAANITLSRARAAAVAAALSASHGVAAGRMIAEGVGMLSPRASNATEAGRAQNRRVEMVLR